MRLFARLAIAAGCLVLVAILFLGGYTLGFIHGHDEGQALGPPRTIAKDLPFLHRQIDSEFPARDF
jgi:hypothetical protein